MSSRKVCVIGAGAAGLIAAKCLREMGHKVIVFERRGGIGGTWNYCSEPIREGHFTSAMYEHLITNLPTEAMQFSDFPFATSVERYPHHTAIQDYLEKFCSQHRLSEQILTKHDVVRVCRQSDLSWDVTVRDLRTQEVSMKNFEAVCICSGHFSEPFVPQLDGLESAMDKGMFEVLHSRLYRKADVPEFKNKRVLVVGGGFSALDIANEICPVSKSLVLSCSEAKEPSLIVTRIEQSGRNLQLENAVRKPLLRRIREDGAIEFVDGTSVVVDTVLFCTGFRYTYPFLNDGLVYGKLQQLVRPLYRHMIHCDFADGSLSFLGLGRSVVPFPFCEVQATYLSAVLRGDISLPNAEEMHSQEEALLSSLRAKFEDERHLHEIDHIEYCRSLISEFQDVVPDRFIVREDRGVRRVSGTSARD